MHLHRILSILKYVLVDSVFCFAFCSLGDPAFRLCLNGLVQDLFAIFVENFPFQREAHLWWWGCSKFRLARSEVVVAIDHIFVDRKSYFLVEAGAGVGVVAVAGISLVVEESPTVDGSLGAAEHAVV